MKIKIFIALLLIVSLAGFIALSQGSRKAFKPAEDFPRGALVYVQIKDLPALIKIWNESELKQSYLASANFDDLKNRHLGLKLASRWEEFNASVGFPIDLETLGGLASGQAAVALYDVGKLEFVFIAPISDEIFAATRFVQSQNNFETQMLSDGSIVYRASVEADRGRQKQELIFTNARNRFVAATSEKLLAQTLDNINQKSIKNRLIDEPSFVALSQKVEPHAATVWVNQAALNADYYFKRYWLMSDVVADLKNIRAGIFDFEIQKDKLIERRKFLLDQTANLQPIKPAQSGKLLSLLPENIPFYRLQAASGETIDGAIREAIFDRRKKRAENKTSNRRRYYSSDDFVDFRFSDYEYLGGKFDEAIDEIGEDRTTAETGETISDFSKIFQSASPQSVLTFTKPEFLPAPLFVEFRRAAIFALASPDNFNRELFESEIEKTVAAQVMVSSSSSSSAPDAKLKWETRSENDVTRRELNLPMLGWSINYQMRGDKLILTDDGDFLSEIAAVGNLQKSGKPDSSLTELTVLNLDQREEAYDRIFDELAGRNAADGFFTSNIASFLDCFSGVGKIEARKNYSGKLPEEEIIINFH